MTATTAFPRPPPDPDVFYGQPIVPVAVFTIVLSTVFVGMRFWSRAVILRSFLLDDWLLLLAWVRSCGSLPYADGILPSRERLGLTPQRRRSLPSLTRPAILSVS